MQFVLPIIAIMILGVVEMTANTTPSIVPTPTPQEQIEEKQKTTTDEDKNEDAQEVKTETTSSVRIIVTHTPATTSEKKPENYFFPNSNMISQSSSEIILETTSGPQEITDWYKNYIKEHDMNTTSFVTTNTNNNILNRLVGANSSLKIDIEITRNDGDEKTKIKILLNS